MTQKFYFLFIFSLLFGLCSCSDDDVNLPESDGGTGMDNDSTLAVITTPANYIWSTSAVVGGTLQGADLSDIDQVGVEYLATHGIEMDSTLFQDNTDSVHQVTATLGSSWSLSIGPLNAETEYAYRAYVQKKDKSKLYGNILSFTTTNSDADNGELYNGEMASDIALADQVIGSDDDYYENSDFTTIITITYKDQEVIVNDPTSKAIVTRNGAYLTMDLATNSLKNVELRVQGRSADGDLKIYSNNKFKITLNGLTLISQHGAAINNQSNKRTFVHLTTGTVNRLTDTTNWSDQLTDEDCKATFFSEGQLIMSGTGVLLLTGQSKHALASDDYIRIRHGVTLVVEASAKDGIHAKDRVTIDGGLTQITSSSDGIEVDEGAFTMTSGKVVIQSADDAICTTYEGTDATIDHSLTITQGEINIKTSGVKAQGLKSTGSLNIDNGTFIIAVNGNASKCLSSDGDMQIKNGSYVLSTTGAAYYEDNDTQSSACIKCDGNLTVDGGTITAQSSGSGGKGISVDGNLIINNGNVEISTTGSKYSYSSKMTSSPKGIKVDGNITINGGIIHVTTSGQNDGAEGIESKKSITITGGETVVNAYDDGINAATSINISAGKVYSFATNNDGMDSNGTINISGGLAIGIGARGPEEGFDCDQNTFKITGGIVIGMGGASSTPTANQCTQKSIIQTISATQNQLFNLSSSDGTSIVTFKFPRTLTSACMLISSPQIANGTYIYKTGVSATGSDWQGYYDGGFTGGSQVASVTVSSIVTGSGGSTGGGPGGGGGRP